MSKRSLCRGMIGVNTGRQERPEYFPMTPLPAPTLWKISGASIKQNELCAFFRGLLDSSGRIAVVPALLVAHIFGLVFWVSGLLVTSMALTRHTQETSAEARQALARLERIYLRGLADPGALLTILAGVSLIMTKPSYYLHAPWLHIKLAFVVLLIGMHGFIAARSKAFAAGRIALQRREARLFVIATLFVFL